MRRDGVQAVVPIYRNDTYGHDLYTNMKDKFEKLLIHDKLNGTIYPGVGYNPPIGKFAASLHRINFIMWDQDLKVLSSNVKDAISQYGANKVGIYIIAFDEIVPILFQAQSHSELLNITKWYGSDGSAQNQRLLENKEAFEFLFANAKNKTIFPNPLAGVNNENKKVKTIENEIINVTGNEPDGYYANAYDALWVAALTLNATRTNDIGILKDKFNQTANSYFGITGNTKLDNKGDRVCGSYDFWEIVKKESGHYNWMKTDKIPVCPNVHKIIVSNSIVPFK